VDVEVRNMNLSKEFIDFSYSSIGFKFRSHYTKLEDDDEEEKEKEEEEEEEEEEEKEEVVLQLRLKVRVGE